MTRNNNVIKRSNIFTIIICHTGEQRFIIMRTYKFYSFKSGHAKLTSVNEIHIQSCIMDMVAVHGKWYFI